MTFLNPWLAAGVAAIAAPILIHMMMRPRPRRIHWAAMRFLQAALQRHEKRLRVEDRLLLLVRCLLIILLALALARPAFQAAGHVPLLGGRTVVIAIDNSLGMGLTDGAATRLDNARTAARQIVDSLPPGSSVALLAFSDVSRPLIADPSADLVLVKRMIGQIVQTDRAADVQPVFRDALDILKRRAPAGGEVYLLTGVPASAWKAFSAISGQAAHSSARISIIIPAPLQEPNLAIADLSLASPFIQPGIAARYTATVHNFGTDTVHNVPVDLSIDDAAPSDEAVIDQIAPGQSRIISLNGKVPTAGFHTVAAQLPPDALPADNRRTIIIHAADVIRVLLVSGSMGATARDADTYFLDQALAPVPPEQRADYFVQTRAIAASDLAAFPLTGFDAVVLANVPQVDPATIAALKAFIGDGGGLMIFPGDLTDADFYNTVFSGDIGGIPALFGDSIGDAADTKKYQTLQASAYRHSMVSIWQDPAAGTLATAHFYQYRHLIPSHSINGASPDEILKFAIGDDAIVGLNSLISRANSSLSGTAGMRLGRILQFASTANTAWNDLPTHPAFVPLMQRALGWLVDARYAPQNNPVGEELSLPAKPEWLTKTATITPPASSPGTVDHGEVELDSGEPMVRYAGVDFAGVYQIHIAADPPTNLLFAAQTDPASSDLAPVPDNVLSNIASGLQVIHWSAGTDLKEVLATQSSSREIWPALALIALALACCETWMSGRFSAAK
jgi:hypothetical protein